MAAKYWVATCEAWVEQDYPHGLSEFIVAGIRSDGEPYSSTGLVTELLLLRDPDCRARVKQEVWLHFNRQLLEDK